MRKKSRRSLLKIFWGEDRGVAATEFALVAPVFIFLIIGVFDYGSLMFERMRMENMAHSAADYMVAGGAEEYLADDLFQNYFSDETQQSGSPISLQTERSCECENGGAISCDAGVCEGGLNDYKRQFQTVEISKTYRLSFSYPGLPEEQVITGRARIQVR